MVLQSAGSPSKGNLHYSTPNNSTVVDFEDGAGGPVAEDALFFCGTKPMDAQTGVGTLSIDLGAGTMAPPWMNGPGNKHEGGGFSPLPEFQGTSYNYYPVQTLHLKKGDRIRATINWDVCPPANNGIGPTMSLTDLDLFLCSPTLATCLTASRSHYNNWEGFDSADVGDIPTEEADWTVSVGFLPNMICGGRKSENIGWAVFAAPNTSTDWKSF